MEIDMLQITDMIDMLPEQEQIFAFEFIKRLVMAWDPDYTKVTPTEAVALEQAMDEFSRGEVIRFDDLLLS